MLWKSNNTIYRQPDDKDRDTIKEILTLSFSPIYAKYANMSFESLSQSLVAEEDSHVIGIINWRIFQACGERVGYIFWLAVHPSSRRKGIGAGLMQQVIDIFKQQQLPIILSTVERTNKPSQQLFGKLGFTRINRAEMRKKYGKECTKLLHDMWLMPWEYIFIKLVPKDEERTD